MGLVGLCIISPNDSDKMEMQQATQDGFIPLFLYPRAHVPQPNFQVPYRVTLTAEELCWYAAKECGIQRLSANLFAIYNDADKNWLAPPAKIKPSHRSLIFRLRYHISRSAAVITSLEENVVAYMFAQYRHDFLHDRIPNITMEERLGLMVLDMVRYANEHGHRTERCLRRRLFQTFLPKSLSKELKLLDIWKLKKKIRKSLSEFERSERDVNKYHMMFLISLMEENESWGSEEFETVRGQRFAVSARLKGVKQIEPASQAEHFKLYFEDILKVRMLASREAGSNSWIVLVNQRENVPKEFEMESKQKAESLVSLIDGYCRLQVDYYHYLLQECAPPSLVLLIKSRCHGPIPLSCAKRKIEEAGSEDGIYLIRQNPEDFFSYCLTARLDGKIKNYKIIVDEDGSVGLPGQCTFPDVRALSDYYRCAVNCACLEGPLIKAIPYQPREESLHLQDLSALPEPPRKRPAEPQIQWIQQDNISERRRWKKLGAGDFTSVYRGEIKQRDKGWIKVAIKRPNRDASQQVQQKFSQSVDVMSSWNNQSIIKFIGIGSGFSLIMAYAPFGSLDKYLQTNQSTIQLSHQIAMAVQLIDALEYLESRNIVHGNICAHNVLVVRSLPKIRVKLGDNMLSKYHHSLPMTRKLKWVRWTAPELLHVNAEPTLESDRWSFGMTLWQIMAMGKIPFENKSHNEVLRLYTSNTFPPLSPQFTESMNTLIKNCWHPVPSDRFTCKHLLMELNRIYMGVQEGDEGAAMHWEVLDEEDGPEPILEDLSEGEEGEESGSEGELMDDPWPMPFSHLDNNMMSTYPGLSPMQNDRYPSTGRLMKFYGIDRVTEGTLEIIGRPIGEGNFGFVFHGVWTRGPMNSLPVAIKEIKREKATEQEMQQFEKEIEQLSSFDHKNIVKVLGIMEAGPDNPLRLVMEYLPLGALNKFLREKKRVNLLVSLSTMLTFAQQVAQGMAYLGAQNVVHRDLAARNVLVASDASDTTEPEVKISDFGLARKYTTEGYYETSGQNRQLPLLLYAIECIWPHRAKFSSMSDVWSFGILLWEIFSYGEKPVYSDEKGKKGCVEDVEIFLQQDKRLPLPADCPQIMYTMMNDCWRLDKHARPSFLELKDRLGRILEDPSLVRM